QPNFALSTNKNVDFVANINGEVVNLGKTNLSFSPNFIASNALIYKPVSNFQISLLSKYVGEQYLSNLESNISSSDVLKSYFVNDLNVSYSIDSITILDSITFTALVNNIFNERYISNGYYYTFDDTWSNPNVVTTIDGAGFYPQATRNFLIGVTLKF
ncbi:MAG TPA: hypothetical protein VJ970_01145, partial [Flavobacteriaceae bacterium]|nr:hypothetical protein [Flavobacteriaceae bacterium]